jgi:hypothetical protein
MNNCEHASFSYFSPYSLLFGDKFKLLASIERDEMVVINLDDFNVWIQTCEQYVALFWCVTPMAMENLAIAQHYDTLHYAIFMEVVIDLKFVNLNKMIMCIYNRKHWLLWMWQQVLFFFMCGRYYLLKCCCWKAKIDRHHKTMGIIVRNHPLLTILWTMLTGPWA